MIVHYMSFIYVPCPDLDFHDSWTVLLLSLITSREVTVAFQRCKRPERKLNYTVDKVHVVRL